MSFLVPSRTILMISDDALFIFSNGARGVKMVDAVPWNVENFEENVAVILAKECGGKPIMIINDMVEQHYRKEKLPKVSMLDKQNVLQRKLNVAFPNYPVRAALPLKEKVAKKAKGTVGVGGIYIFAAIPNSDAFTKTMDAARRSMAPIAGFGLLPVEASDMLKKLSEKLTPKGQKKSRWTVFIGQHRGGGLRQIVTKDGELALTRMTPIGNLDSDPLKWATEVFQEFKATMSYLSRFGLDVADGLDVILIANTAAGEMVEKMLETPCNFYALTSEDAAAALKLSLGQQDDDCLADSLHVAWIGRKSALILPMKAKEIDKVSKPRQMATLASVVLVMGAGFLCYQLMDYMQAVTTTWDDIETQERRISELDAHLQKEIKRKEDLGFDIQLIQSSLAVRDEFENAQVRALDLFYNIRRGLGRNLRIDRIEIGRGEVTVIDPFANPEDQKVPQFVATMQMTFPSTMDAKKGNKEVQDLQGVLQTILSDHTVKVTKFLEDYEYSEAMVVETGETDQKSASQDYVAEIQIQGPML